MSMRSLSPVVYDKRPITVVGLMHPLNVVPLLSLAVVLIFASALVAFGVSLAIDVAVVAAVSRVPSVRERLERHARKRARRRAAQQLRDIERREWQELEALVERTEPARAAAQQLDALLALYVNVGQAMAKAGNALDAACTERADALKRSTSFGVSDGTQQLVDLRIDCVRRATRAMEAVQQQLQHIAQLVHLGCEQAAVADCEQAASVWQSDVEEATQRARLDTAMLLAVEPDLALLADA